MALRLHPVGKGPLAPAVNVYNNDYDGDVDETTWEVETSDFEKNLKENAKKGLRETQNYSPSEQRSTAWSNRPKTSSIGNLSPIVYNQSPRTAEFSPFAYNVNKPLSTISSVTNSSSTLGNLGNLNINLEKTSTQLTKLKKNRTNRNSRKNRRAKKSRKGRKAKKERKGSKERKTRKN